MAWGDMMRMECRRAHTLRHPVDTFLERKGAFKGKGAGGGPNPSPGGSSRSGIAGRRRIPKLDPPSGTESAAQIG